MGFQIIEKYCRYDDFIYKKGVLKRIVIYSSSSDAQIGQQDIIYSTECLH